MLDLQKTLDLLSDLTLLKYFPAEPSARLALAKQVLQMASTHEQVEWLVARTMSICNEWPGPLVLRQIFCSKFKPRDGVESGPTTLFPEGLPPERPIQPPALPALPPGHVATIDASLDKRLQVVAKTKDLNASDVALPSDFAHLQELRRARLRRQHREIVSASGMKPITQEDIDRAVAEAREKKEGAE